MSFKLHLAPIYIMYTKYIFQKKIIKYNIAKNYVLKYICKSYIW